ncbi:MAG: transketolase C-terminal domain-containing protein [Candidatus Xenobium sp.]|nr:hypothetical protein [Burkholderiales bacterium]
MRAIPRSDQVRAALSQTLLEAAPGPVAWSGAGGAAYYRACRGGSRSLERIASWAEDEVDLLHLALGWRHARIGTELDGPLTLVIEDLPPGFLAALEAATPRNMDLMVVFLDAARRYGEPGRSPWNRNSGSPGPYAEARGFRFSQAVEATRPDRLARAFQGTLAETGVRFLHVLGPALDEAPPTPSGRRSAENWLATRVDRPRPSWPAPVGTSTSGRPPASDSFETQALARLTSDLAQTPEVVCFWARSSAPGPLAALGRRLKRCSLKGVLLEAAGAAAAGRHPVVAVSAPRLPLLLPELFEMAVFPLTLLVMGGGLTPVHGSDEPDPAAVRDLAFLRQLPEITIAVPADEEEARGVLRGLLELPGLGALRLASSPAIGVPDTDEPPSLLPGVGRRLRPGGDLSLLCLGSTVFPAILASEALNSWGVRAGVYDLRYLEPVDGRLLAQAAECGRILTAEEHCLNGGLGTTVLENLARMGRTDVQVEVLGIRPDLTQADPEAHGLSAEGIVKAARRILGLGAGPSPQTGEDG